MAVFGGHRIWQGYDSMNSYRNNWEDHSSYQAGGYLSDLWIYTRVLDYDTIPGETLKRSLGSV